MSLAWVILGSVWAAEPAGTEALAEATAIVETIGGRPTGSDGVEVAAGHVMAALAARDWRPRRVPGGDVEPGVLACREGAASGTRLFLAHLDTVHADVVGANDNAAAIGVLLEVASRLPDALPHTVCLGFPAGEELGLLGSEAMAAAEVVPAPIDVVVALDLVGVGRPTWNGLGPAWDGPRLSWLLSHAPRDVPWMYRAVSVADPGMERSDHGPFARRGVLAAHLMARGRSGVDWAYHTPADTLERLDRTTLGAGVDDLVAVALAPPPPAGPAVFGRWAAVVPWTAIVLPGPLVIALLLGCLVLVGDAVRRVPGAAWMRASRPKPAIAGLARVLGGVAAAGIGATIAHRDGVLHGEGLTLGVVAMVGFWGAWWSVQPEPDDDGGVRAAVAATLTLVVGCVVAYVAGPQLGVPVIAGAAGLAVVSRPRWGWVGWPAVLWAGGYLLAPVTLRELAFHHLIPWGPVPWIVVGALVSWPWTAVWPRAAVPARAIAVGLGVGLSAALVAPMVERETTARADADQRGYFTRDPRRASRPEPAATAAPVGAASPAGPTDDGDQ